MTITISPRGAIVRVGLGQRFQIAAQNLLVQLGELAADRGFALGAKPGGEIGKRGGKARPGLEQNERRRNAREFGDAGAARGFFRRQKAGEQKLIGRQTRDGQCRKQRRRAGQRGDRVAGVLRGAHQLVSGIGDKRRAGIGDERDRRAFGKPPQQERPRLCRVVLVIGRQAASRSRSGRAICG